jgi:hypothetical protein
MHGKEGEEGSCTDNANATFMDVLLDMKAEKEFRITRIHIIFHHSMISVDA